MTDHVQLDTPMQLGDVSLAPIMEADKEGLRAAANSEEIWNWYVFRGDGDYFDTQFWMWYYELNKNNSDVKFVVRHKGKIVGATCFLAVDRRNRRLEIGGTWYTDDVRGTIVNPACKLLLTQRAFDWGAQRVEWKTDSNNKRSRAAIEKLGAQYEGTFRNHMFLHDGRVRHTVYYSMIPEEWPAAKEKLLERLSAFA